MGPVAGAGRWGGRGTTGCALAPGRSDRDDGERLCVFCGRDAPQGNLIIRWPALVTTSARLVAGGTINVTLGTGESLSAALVPNTARLAYHVVVYQLGPGELRTERLGCTDNFSVKSGDRAYPSGIGSSHARGSPWRETGLCFAGMRVLGRRARLRFLGVSEGFSADWEVKVPTLSQKTRPGRGPVA